MEAEKQELDKYEQEAARRRGADAALKAGADEFWKLVRLVSRRFTAEWPTFKAEVANHDFYGAELTACIVGGGVDGKDIGMRMSFSFGKHDPVDDLAKMLFDSFSQTMRRRMFVAPGNAPGKAKRR